MQNKDRDRQTVKEKDTLKREDVIPDYDYLFDEKEDKNGKKSKNFFGKILKINLRSIILSTLIFIIQYSPQWLLPVITANIINTVTQAVTTGQGATPEVWRTIIINVIVLALLFAQNVPTTVWRRHIDSRMVRNTSAGIKSSVVRKLQSLSITYHKDMQSGKIQAKFLKDTEAVDGLFRNLLNGIIPCVFTIAIALAISIYTNWMVSLFFLVIVPCDILLIMAFRKKIIRSYHDYRVKTETLSAKMNTMLEMMPVTKSHGLESTEISSFNKTIKKLTGSGYTVDMVEAKFGASAWVVHSVLNGVCLVVCSILALKSVIGVGDIVLYQSMFNQIISSVSSLVGLIPAFGSGLDALSSVSEIMNAKDVEVSIGKKHVPCIKGDVSFNNVSYCYPNTDKEVVKNLTLDVKSGECVAFVGASGSGKSTVMNMIIGFLKATEGDILIDGKSIGDFNLSEYRHHISVVPQNSVLFDGTIRENITYGLDKYSESDFERVVEMANLGEFVKELPKGYDTYIGEHGDKLSGGQKQRITIARALIRDPRILILDEATSALDNISEYHVQKAISSSIRGRTTFIVAHRLSTIRDADRIVVMEQGVPVEIGNYEQLMAKKGKFFELKQLNEINFKKAEEGLGV